MAGLFHYAMHILINVICGFIPSKGLRSAVRRNYVKDYFKQKRIIRKTPDSSSYPNYLSIVAIVKDEAPYLAEWIEYHRLAGVEKFYIYDNESTDNIKEVLAPYLKDSVVEYKFWPGQAQQTKAYDDAIGLYKYKSKWIAFIDIDEFIVPIEKSTIPDFLKDYEDISAVGINWLIYGDNGAKRKTDGLVIERFTAHSLPAFERNRTFKSIVNPRQVIKMTAHAGHFIGNFTTVNSNREKQNHSFKRKPVYDKIRINHYWGKSYEEFQIKKYRGDVAYADAGPKSDSEFEYYNRNEIENDGTMKKYVSTVNREISVKV
ncbi:MAG: glycosyltransferase family 92 protein [Rickettsiales bacterium]|jgi:hypothetical protein|nr:glycosyltransferase family 92 protein [Rickettsiales bacterium]